LPVGIAREESVMGRRRVSVLLGVIVLGGAVWLAGQTGAGGKPAGWTEVLPGVWRSPGRPAGYALVDGDRALVIDAACPPDGLEAKGIRSFAEVLLTHHHRDGLVALPAYLKRTVRVRAPKASADYLNPDAVARYWRESLPLRNSRTAYLVLPEGIAGVEYTLDDKSEITFGDWVIRAVTTPGHSFDHTAYLARKKSGGKSVLFAGDALAAPERLWSPYTTDWDHWTDAGLRPAVASLRKLAALGADLVLPAHGDAIAAGGKAALERTAAAVEVVAFLKSYERFTRDRRKDPPRYAFLAKEQPGSNGSLPWARLAKPLWFTGNTYVLASKDGPCLVVDPWDPYSAKQIPKLQKDEKLGPVEVVLCSHAHFDHYDGAYALLERDRPEVWTLDQVAGPIADPFRLRAPFLDARPLKVARRFKDGETARWREYTLKFHFLPGQSLFTMGVETAIDGKRCLFTADNFFHHDLYSGTGGWMGLNRSGPDLYEQSARKVLEIAPEWVLAEHGSAMEFSAADFKRRVEWAKVSGAAADLLCVSGTHRHDWNPHHVRVEPVLQKGRPGEALTAELVVENVLAKKRTLRVALQGRGQTPDQAWQVEVGPGATVRRPLKLRLSESLLPGRHVFALEAREGDAVEPGDAFVAVETPAGR
jgi:glyoxylase-like metal-dependent hydrolase (beta-lactamase superfamily II)